MEAAAKLKEAEHKLQDVTQRDGRLHEVGVSSATAYGTVRHNIPVWYPLCCKSYVHLQEMAAFLDSQPNTTCGPMLPGSSPYIPVLPVHVTSEQDMNII